MQVETNTDRLVQRFREGDPIAFEKLFDQYSQKLYGFVQSYLKNIQESEEITQDVFYKLWINRSYLKSDEAFKSYLFKVALNNIRAYFNRKNTEEKHKQLVAQEFILLADSSADEMEYSAVMKLVDQIIDQMPAKRREIFLLSRKEGLDINEISNHLNLSESTVKNQLTNAIAFLKDEVKKNNLSSYLFFMLFYR
ncbi:RNA polymerase sigma-70 factor [Puteibacter caeruleilacunae]|nr:RNA polymerase sigma-70 factor [Puteibacter caeruleilacunae]